MGRSRLLTGVVIVALVCSAIGATPAVAQTAQQSGQVIGQPELSISTTANEFSAGTTNSLSLTVVNRGQISEAGPAEYEERVTTARGLTLDVDDEDSPIDVQANTIPLGNLPTGSVSTDPIRVSVAEGTEPGTYEVPVEYEYAFTRAVNYDGNRQEYRDSTRTRTEDIEIEVTDQAQFAVVDRETTAQVGETGDLSVTIENTGSQPARDAAVQVTSQSDELTLGTGSQSSTAYAGSWAPGENRTVTYTVNLSDGATERSYSLTARVQSEDTDGLNQTSPPFTVGVPAQAEQTFAVESLESTLQVGREGQLSGTLTNTGPAPVSEPVLEVASNSENVDFTSAEYALPRLEPGQSEDFEFEVDVSDAAAAGSQQFRFAVSYQNQRGDDHTSSAVRKRVQVEPNQDLFTLAPENGTVTAGSSRDVRLNLTNEGEEALTDVSAKAFLDDPLSTSNDEAFVPELAPGESTTITMPISVAEGATAATYPIEVDFEYTEPDGDTKVSKTYKAPITVAPSDGGGGLPIGLIVVLVLLGLGAVWVYRR